MMNLSSLSKAQAMSLASLASLALVIVAGVFGLSHIWLISAALITVALNIGASFFIGVATRNLRKIKHVCSLLAQGNLEERLYYPLESSGEVEDVRLAINHFTDLVDAFLREAKYATDSTCRNRFYRTIITTGLHGAFVQTSEVINKANNASGSKNDAIGQLVKVIREIVGSERGGVNTGDAAASGIDAIASATEESSASIAEINRQITQSSVNTREAEAKASHLEGAAQSLQSTTGEIGQIVSMITGIAEQTNLLALNATIEAARAGDAGKGFAVVANEVKKLANQTSEATKKIVSLVENINAAVSGTVQDVNGMKQVIVNINETTGSIAAAIEEQGYASREIARSATIVSEGLQSIGQRVEGISDITRKLAPTTKATVESSHEETVH